ncbi:hypothetical protein Nepgr_008272 [Nepenthes gracilis]|uniref:Dof zinc finger protein n=1 Tax=Nepenthes gracilis TaxID=150966 RepID=A0AAD3XJ26_NEPGR|nr:hypothetical protein Nepgr_008272 [Nepenthes gracilis]
MLRLPAAVATPHLFTQHAQNLSPVSPHKTRLFAPFSNHNQHPPSLNWRRSATLSLSLSPPLPQSFSGGSRMPSETNERRHTKPQHMGAPNPAGEQEPLPCPRCDSANTKFCYYNNYNFSQPRHFCKSCRRYWTHGGTLRDVPVGGGTRKNAKRSRGPPTFSSSAVTTAAPASIGSPLDPISATPLFAPLSGAAAAGPHVGDLLLKSGGVGMPGGSFTSLLNTSGPGFFALGGFGLGLGPGFEEVGFGLGRGPWPFPDVGYLSSGGGGVVSGGGGGRTNTGTDSNASGNTWQPESGGESGFMGGDCFSSWPAISTPGNGLK